MAERMTVLIIDDEPHVVRAVRNALAAEFDRVIEAASAREGIDQAAAQRPDAIVLDLGLPDAPGISVCSEIRKWVTARAQARGTRYGDHLREARRLLEAKELHAALAHLQRALEADPGRPEAHNMVGVIEELHRNRAEAQRHYRTALELDPAYAPARENLEASTRDPTLRGRPSLGGDPD